MKIGQNLNNSYDIKEMTSIFLEQLVKNTGLRAKNQVLNQNSPVLRKKI